MGQAGRHESVPGRINRRCGVVPGAATTLLSLVSLTFLLTAFAIGPALAQQIERPGDRRKPLPEFAPEPAQPEFVLPPVAPPPKERVRPPPGLRIFVRRFELTGNTVFSVAELRQLTAPYEGREITSEELEELRQALTLHYVNAGYVNSGVIIPDQDVVEGVVTIDIIEGELTEVSVAGSGRLRPEYITSRIRLGAGRPLNVIALQERLQILLQDPLIERITAKLGPGLRLGESELKVDVKRGRPYALGFAVANDRSPSIGAIRGEAQGIVRNLTGWGDTLMASVGGSEGLLDGKASFTLPVTSRDTTLNLSFEKNRSDVVEEPFDDIDIESESDTYAVTLRHPFYRTPTREFSLGLTLARRSSETLLLGRPFSFSPGVRDGKSDVTVIRFSQEWIDRDQNQVIAARSVFSFGIDAFGATNNPSGPDGEFMAWLGQFQWARRVGLDIGHGASLLVFRADAQLTNVSLLPLEQFAVGGADIVRGYRENQLVRDKGVVLSLEGRIPILRLPIPGLSSAPEDGIVQLAAFVDYGRAWNEASPNPEIKKIYSVGAGIRWSLTRRIHAQLYFGQALKDVPDPADRDLQDFGIHFRIGAQLF